VSLRKDVQARRRLAGGGEAGRDPAVQPDAGRERRRDRAPHHPGRPRVRDAGGRGLLRRGCDRCVLRAADAAVRLGPSAPAESYLRIDAAVSAALESGAEAVHPGYGSLSERAAFARAVEDAGLVFVGSSAATIATLGGKLAARRTARAADVPHVPGTLEPAPVDRPEQLAAVLAAVDAVGFPLIKAVAGGGGRGMRRVVAADELPSATAPSTWSARSCPRATSRSSSSVTRPGR
jgi:hypothetical protein